MIQTNEGPPDKSVQIMAHVIARPDSTYPIIITPYKLDLSQFTEKAREKVTFKINNVSEKKVKPTIVSSPGDFFTIKLPNSINPGSSAEGTLTLKAAGLKEGFEKSFTIQLDDEKKTRFTVPVKRTVQTVGGDSTVTAHSASGGH
jgi:hypothetical protein